MSAVPECPHLVLVGLMGSGKTTVGRVVAERMGRHFHDTDAIIEARTGRSVREIFSADGEEAFRDLEAEVLAEIIAEEEPSVIAGAGGVVLREANRAALRAGRCRVVWLCADPAHLIERVTNGGHRPLLDDDPEARLRQMFIDREAFYREVAHAIVRTDGRNVHEVVEAVLR